MYMNMLFKWRHAVIALITVRHVAYVALVGCAIFILGCHTVGDGGLSRIKTEGSARMTIEDARKALIAFRDASDDPNVRTALNSIETVPAAELWKGRYEFGKSIMVDLLAMRFEAIPPFRPMVAPTGRLEPGATAVAGDFVRDSTSGIRVRRGFYLAGTTRPTAEVAKTQTIADSLVSIHEASDALLRMCRDSKDESIRHGEKSILSGGVSEIDDSVVLFGGDSFDARACWFVDLHSGEFSYLADLAPRDYTDRYGIIERDASGNWIARVLGGGK
jgi:hypothetical protein